MSKPLYVVNADEVDLMSSPPPDRFLLNYWIFLLLGVGGLIPWNAFLTAGTYWDLMFPGLGSFQFIMSIVFNIATMMFQFIGVALGNRLPLTLRMMLTFVPFAVAMVMVPFVRNMVEGESARLGITMALVFVSGMSTAFGFICVVGLASQFPPTYVGAVMTGQGVAGIIVGAIRIITMAAYFGEAKVNNVDPGTVPSTLIYFLLAAGFEVACVVAYFVLIRTPFARYHMSKASRSVGTEAEALLGSTAGGSSLDENGAPKASIGTVVRKVALMGFTVWSVFFITLSFFPGMTVLIPANPDDFPHNSSWFLVINIFIFQVFDFIGRSLPRWMIIIRPRLLWIFSLSRLIFCGLFVLCLLPKYDITVVPHVYPLIFSNWAPYAIMACFAITNGYFGTLSMMFAPDLVEDYEKSLAGMIMSVFLQIGIFSAVLFALFILFLIQPCTLPSFLMSESLTVTCNTTAHNATALFL